jgi:site-specific DNA-methyltransferase (adenine-specific)
MSLIYNGDCFEEMKKIKNKCIKLVLLDLPYGQTACEWDTCIDLQKMWDEFDRICDDRCQYLFFCTTKFGINILNSRPKWFKTDYVFEKVHGLGFLNCNRAVLRKHEMIYHFSNPKFSRKTFNVIKTDNETRKTRRRTKTIECCVYGVVSPSINDMYIGRYQTSIFKTSINNINSFHPTQKPLDILELLIRTFSNENDFVLDITAGSGSVGIACINTNRKYILIEKNEEFFRITEQRVLKSYLQNEILD